LAGFRSFDDAAPELAEHVVLPVGELLGPSSSPRFNEIPAGISFYMS
jgi:hypothetical protein